MPLVEYHDMFERVLPDTANDSLHVRILPRTTRCNLDCFEPQIRHPLLEMRAINTVAITQQIARCGVPRKGLDDLLSRPLGGGVVAPQLTVVPAPPLNQALERM